MYQAVCAECGNSCEVPFKPTGDRPIYCSKCFEIKERKGGKRFGGRDSEGSGFADRDSRHTEMFRATCAECGKSCEIPFEPRDDRPVYCDDCFENRRNGDRNFKRPERSDNRRPNFEVKSNNEQYKGQFDSINAKLDKILKLLAVVPAETAPKEEVKVFKDVVPEKVKAEKPKKAAKKAVTKKKKE